MITKEQYTDLQILQGTDFEHDIVFDKSFDVSDYTWSAQIASDFSGTAFTWGDSTATFVKLDVENKDVDDDNEITIKLSDVDTSKFADDFEGVWELISKKTSGGILVREIQGDVVLSKGIVDTQTASNFAAAS